MDLTLSEAEVELLRRILTSYAGDLRMEIADTDNHEFKANLRDEQTQLNAIIERLSS